MKTVMKKMFSLLLVAVLLVGVMPTAFADGVSDEDHIHNGNWDDGVITTKPTCTEPGTKLYTCSCGITTTEPVEATGHTAGDAATCTTAQTCTTCGTELAPVDTTAHSYDAGTITTPATCDDDGVKTYSCACGDTYTETVPASGHSYDAGTITTPATCSATGIKTFTCANNSSHTYTEEVAIDPNAHNFSDKGVCTLCNLCENCDLVGAHKTNCIFNCNGAANCPNDPANKEAHNAGCLKTKCNKNGCTKDYGHTGECSVPCKKTAGCALKQGHDGSCNTPCTFSGCTNGYNHSGDHSNACATCGLAKIKSPEHKSNCQYYYVSTGETIPSGNYSLKVYARIWVGEKLHDVRLLDTITNISSNAKVYQVVAANADRLESKFPSGYHGIQWLDNIFYKTNKNKFEDVYSTLSVGSEDEVYINLYSAEKLVVVNVHTSKSYSYDLSVRVEGFRVGDLVTYEDVLAAVKEYYNVSSMSIYTYNEMEKLIAGVSANKTQNFTVTDGDNRYEVYLQGSRKGSSSGGYTYTADSSNPKTGDMIFAPAIIMGASFTCLAVLFYLNKKRAY